MEKQEKFFLKVLGFFKPFWKSFSIIIVLMTAGQVLNALSPYLFGKGVDAVTKGNVHATFMFLGIAFVISFAQTGVIGWVRDQIELRHLDAHIENAFSVNSIKKMFGFSIGQHVNEHSGVKQTIVNKGQNSLSSMMYTLLYSILPGIIQIVVTLIILAVFDWKIAFVALSFVLTYILVALRRNKQFFPIISEMRKKNQSQSKLQSELYRNSTTNL